MRLASGVQKNKTLSPNKVFFHTYLITFLIIIYSYNYLIDYFLISYFSFKSSHSNFQHFILAKLFEDRVLLQFELAKLL